MISFFKKWAVGLVFLFLLSLTASSLWAGEQIVRLNQEANATRTGEAHERAMLKAVLQDALEIIPTSLDLERRRVFKEFLQSRHDNFVLSYARLGQGQTGNVVWQVRVNTKALTDLLKETGIYYTAEKPLTYRLQPISALSAQEANISRMENLFGLRKGQSDGPRLDIGPTREGKGWSGTLYAQDRSWSAEHQQFQEVWLQVWAGFFTCRECVRPFVQELRLRISGWSSLSGAQAFDQRLSQWPQVVDEATLKSMLMKAEGIEGQWSIRSPRSQALQEDIEAFALPRGLTWSVEPAS